MSFDFSTLITDRSQADLDALRGLLSTPMSDWTAEQLAAFNLAKSRGAYNYTDLNRVTEAMEALDGMLRAQGYESGYQKLVVNSSQSGGGLPEGYTELEWIQSDSTAYINTGFIPDGLSRIVMQIAVFSSSDWQAPFGARNTSNSRDETSNVLFFSPANFPRWDYYGSTYTLQDSVPIQEKIDIDLNQNVISVNNETHEFPAVSASSGYPWFLFDVNTGGSPRESGQFRLYSCKIYDDGTLIRDFVPAKKSDGTIGLYDRVSGTVYTNAGSGAFTAGPVVPDFDTKDRINVTPTMTSNITPSGYVASASSVHETRDAWRAFNGDNLEWHSGPGLPQWLQLQFPDAIRVDELCIRNPAADSYGTKGITTFSLLGSNDGASFDVLGEYTNNPGNGLCNCFTVINPGTYKIYRIQITGTGYVFEGNPYCVITEATFYQLPDPVPELDPYTWYEENTPTETLMAAYLANVNAIWGTLLDNPDLPETMAGLTTDGANRIEQALLTVLDFLKRMAIDLFYCGEVYCGEV